jgi:hypothetical protein
VPYFNTELYLSVCFTHYNTADAEIHGHDSTVGLPTDDEIKRASVSEFTPETLLLAGTR